MKYKALSVLPHLAKNMVDANKKINWKFMIIPSLSSTRFESQSSAISKATE